MALKDLLLLTLSLFNYTDFLKNPPDGGFLFCGLPVSMGA
ncbi:hypothetical protein DDI_0994 [Dickeya dianthicola RNS04.9]|nr:hypothetical protein DDI_0994 [Dickeya dianthicola RNS04.9]